MICLDVPTPVRLRTVAIGVLGKRGEASDRARIEPFLKNPDPRLSGAARFALKRFRAPSDKQ
jgi:hypothetical protein